MRPHANNNLKFQKFLSFFHSVLFMCVSVCICMWLICVYVGRGYSRGCLSMFWRSANTSDKSILSFTM